MASLFFSVLLSQFFANQSEIKDTTESIMQPVSSSSTTTEQGHWTIPWRWVWTSETMIYDLLTAKPSSSLFPPHRMISNGVFISVFLFCVGSLYALFIVPFSWTTRQKQILAFPLLLSVFFQPFLFTCPVQFFHMVITAAAIGVTSRMVDLYYVQPWTGVPSRYCLSMAHVDPMDATARSKKDLDTPNSDHNIKSLNRCQGDDEDAQFDRFLTWDMNRFKMEMWSPLRKFSNCKKTKVDSGTGISWQYLLGRGAIFMVLLDIGLFLMSNYTVADVEAFQILQYVAFIAGVASFIMLYVLWACYSIAFIYSICNGCRRIDPSEWTMLGSKLPCFALTPVELWNNWHTLFRYLWVDLGFLPVQRLCMQHLGPDLLGPRASKMVREALPVLSVFVLSGILHAYVVYAKWREPVWSQLVYFMFQGVAVVVTKAVERTWVGGRIRDSYAHGHPMARLCLQGVGMLAMLFYHVMTLPLFMHPYLKHRMWYEIRGWSILWWILGE